MSERRNSILAGLWKEVLRVGEKDDINKGPMLINILSHQSIPNQRENWLIPPYPRLAIASLGITVLKGEWGKEGYSLFTPVICPGVGIFSGVSTIMVLSFMLYKLLLESRSVSLYGIYSHRDSDAKIPRFFSSEPLNYFGMDNSCVAIINLACIRGSGIGENEANIREANSFIIQRMSLEQKKYLNKYDGLIYESNVKRVRL
jgi:hypothetical protein